MLERLAGAKLARKSIPSNVDSDCTLMSPDEEWEDPSYAGPSTPTGTRHRGSACDVQVARTAENERMSAVHKSAELREQACMNVLKESHQLKLALLDKALDAAKTEGEKDRSVAKEQLSLARAAKEASTAAFERRVQGNEVMEMTKLFVGQGKDPLVAWQLALDAVMGGGPSRPEEQGLCFLTCMVTRILLS
jgi:hypothetical protein